MSDPGLDALAYVYQALGAEDEWTQTAERAFRWFGSPIPITVSAGPVELVQGDPTSRITATVPIAAALTSSPEDIAIACTMNNVHATAGAMTLSSTGDSVVAQIAHNYYQDNEFNLTMFGQMARLLYAETVQRADQLAEKLGRMPVDPENPLSHRPTPAPLFNEIAAAVTNPPTVNPFGSDEISTLCDFITEQVPGSTPFANEGFLSAQLFIEPSEATGSSFSLLLTVHATEHPHFGPGLQVLLKIMIADELSPMLAAHELNMQEGSAGPDSVDGRGAWTMNIDGNVVVHNQFWPHFVYAPDLARSAVLYEITRGPWAIGQLSAMLDRQRAS